MIIKCGKCKAVLQFDENKINTKTFVLSCPNCMAKNNVIIPTKDQELENETLKLNKEDEETLINNQDNEITSVINYEKESSPNPEKKNKEVVGWLVVHTENVKVRTFELYPGTNLIGRPTKTNEIDIPIKNDEYLSRKHCQIKVEFKKNKWTFLLSEDPKHPSTNGTFLNTKRINVQDQIYLKDGDTIQAGRTKLVFKSKQLFKNSDYAASTVVNTNYEDTIVT